MISTGTHKRCYYVKVGATKGHTHTHTQWWWVKAATSKEPLERWANNKAINPTKGDPWP